MKKLVRDCSYNELLTYLKTKISYVPKYIIYNYDEIFVKDTLDDKEILYLRLDSTIDLN